VSHYNDYFIPILYATLTISMSSVAGNYRSQKSFTKYTMGGIKFKCFTLTQQYTYIFQVLWCLLPI